MSAAVAPRTGRTAGPRHGARHASPVSRSSPIPRTRTSPLAERAERLLAREICFVHNIEFARPRAEPEILADADPPAPRRVATRTPPAGLPAYFATLYAVPLLGPEEERRLFRRMNFLKFRANAMRSRIDPRDPDEELLDEAEHCLADAEAIRSRIVQANLRLVVALARKYSDSPDLFDELLADGNLMLLNAVDKFDYGRGFRFSTYATHAVRRSFFRLQRRRWADSAKSRGLGDAVYDLADPESAADDGDEGPGPALCQGLRLAIESALDERERSIVGARFGLGEPGGAACTLQQLASRLDLCKERVRQLQMRALAKLKEAVAPLVAVDSSQVPLGSRAAGPERADTRRDAVR